MYADERNSGYRMVMTMTGQKGNTMCREVVYTDRNQNRKMVGFVVID